MKSSVWVVNSRYYIDGKSISIPSGLFQTADTDAIAKKLKEYVKMRIHMSILIIK